MSKTAVVYYSFEGHTEELAKKIADELKADIFKLEPVKDIKTHGFFKYIIGGFRAIRDNSPQLKNINPDTEKYDLIVLGSPVWAGKCAPAVNTFIFQNNLEGKNIALFCSNRGAVGQFFQNIEDKMGKVNIKEKEFFLEKDSANKAKVKEFVSKLK